MPSTSSSFPRGVADAAGRRAYVRDHAGTVLALDLTTGYILWRAEAGLRPLAIVDAMLVAARLDRPHEVSLVYLDRFDGRVIRMSKPISLPDWVALSLHDTPDFTLRAEVEGPTVVLRWSARGRYQGGAPPSANVRHSYEHDAHGTARVHVDTGNIELVHEPAAALEGVEPPTLSSSESNVIEQRELGQTRFQLVSDDAGGTAHVRLRAIDQTSGQTLWETGIDEFRARRPKPLRP